MLQIRILRYYSHFNFIIFEDIIPFYIRINVNVMKIAYFTFSILATHNLCGF
jgi:hypothetical protein